jgi:azurin
VAHSCGRKVHQNKQGRLCGTRFKRMHNAKITNAVISTTEGLSPVINVCNTRNKFYVKPSDNNIIVHVNLSGR